MATPDTINVAQLNRLIGTPDAPVIIDVRIDNDHAADPRMLPASVRRDYRTVASWAGEYAGRSVVVVCQRGQKLSQGVAAWLRHAGARAENLEGGFEAWIESKGLLVRPDHVPERDKQGAPYGSRVRGRRSIASRARGSSAGSSIPSAVFLFVAPSEVADVADAFARRRSTSMTSSGATAASSARSM